MLIQERRVAYVTDENNPEFKTTLFSEPKTRRNAIKSIASGMTPALSDVLE